MHAAKQHLQFRRDIEGLRGVAVLLVVLFHAGVPWLTGGFVGVDVFFVISGYLITAILAGEIARTGTISLSRFFARRIRRLLPAAAVVLVATLALSAFVFPPLQVISTAVSARAAAAYVSNVHFLRQASDYFSGDVRLNPTLHTWSLAVEEQFYLLWPLVLLALARLPRGVSGDSRRTLAWGLTAIGMLSFVAACSYAATDPSMAFYATPLRAWEFACGGLASLVAARSHAPRRTAVSGVANGIMGWLGIALIMAAGVRYSPATEFPGLMAFPPVAGTALLLIAGAIDPRPSRGSVGYALSLTPIRWIGRRSYSWYLWHWPVTVLGVSMLSNGGVLPRLGLAVVALTLADLTYRFVETPTRAPRVATPGPPPALGAWRTIRLGLAATAMLVACAEGARLRGIGLSREPLQLALTTAAADLAPVYADGCINYRGESQVHVCRYGLPSARTTIALFGDSHAAQWLPALQALARARDWTVIVIAKTRCATADVPVYLPQTGERATSCERWRRDAIDSLRKLHPAVVVLSNALCYIRTPMLPPDVRAVSVDTWEAGMSRTLNTFRAAGVPTIVIRDTPGLLAAVLTCVGRSGWVARQRGACSMSRSLAVNDDVGRSERRVTAAVPGSHVVDLTDALCRPDACAPVIADKVAYQDGDHLTATMTRLLAPMFLSTLDSAVAESSEMSNDPTPDFPKSFFR